jgi:hypothetical protein
MSCVQVRVMLQRLAAKRTKLCMQLEIGPSATNEDRVSLY